MRKGYKIFEIKDGYLRTLFHGIARDLNMTLNKWIRAENKYRRDGGGSRKYITGIHVMKTYEDAVEYLENFRVDKNRVIVEVWCENVREKPMNEDVLLADWMYIPANQEILEGVKNETISPCASRAV